MPKFVIIALLASSAAAQAAPAVKTFDRAAVQTFDRAAVLREQRIKDLSEPPPSVRNICRGC
jgi:hypothetical protein